jgi:hypothetical protein
LLGEARMGKTSFSSLHPAWNGLKSIRCVKILLD